MSYNLLCHFNISFRRFDFELDPRIIKCARKRKDTIFANC